MHSFHTFNHVEVQLYEFLKSQKSPVKIEWFFKENSLVFGKKIFIKKDSTKTRRSKAEKIFLLSKKQNIGAEFQILAQDNLDNVFCSIYIPKNKRESELLGFPLAYLGHKLEDGKINPTAVAVGAAAGALIDEIDSPGDSIVNGAIVGAAAGQLIGGDKNPTSDGHQTQQITTSHVKASRINERRLTLKERDETAETLTTNWKKAHSFLSQNWLSANDILNNNLLSFNLNKLNPSQMNDILFYLYQLGFLNLDIKNGKSVYRILNETTFKAKKTRSLTAFERDQAARILTINWKQALDFIPQNGLTAQDILKNPQLYKGLEDLTASHVSHLLSYLLHTGFLKLNIKEGRAFYQIIPNKFFKTVHHKTTETDLTKQHPHQNLSLHEKKFLASHHSLFKRLSVRLEILRTKKDSDLISGVSIAVLEDKLNTALSSEFKIDRDILEKLLEINIKKMPHIEKIEGNDEDLYRFIR